MVLCYACAISFALLTTKFGIPNETSRRHYATNLGSSNNGNAIPEFSRHIFAHRVQSRVAPMVLHFTYKSTQKKTRYTSSLTPTPPPPLSHNATVLPAQLYRNAHGYKQLLQFHVYITRCDRHATTATFGHSAYGIAANPLWINTHHRGADRI